MHASYFFSEWIYSWGFYVFFPLAVILILIKLLARRNWKRLDESYRKSWANQEEMIALLKEIRDSLKK